MFGLRKYIFAQINQNDLLLALATQKYRRLTFHAITRVPLSSLDIHRERIFNPTKLVNLIKIFSSQHAIKTKRLIVSVPFLNNTNPFQLLQAALCFSKHGFVIHHLGNQSLVIDDTQAKTPFSSNNLLNSFLPNGFHATRHFVSLVGITLCLLVTGSFYSYYDTQHALHHLDHQIHTEEVTLTSLKKTVAAMHKIKNQTKILEQKITPLQAHLFKKPHQHNVLSLIAQSIPPDSKLIDIKIDTTKTNTKPPKELFAITLTGKTFHPEETGLWAQQLTNQLPRADFLLSHLKKIPVKARTKRASPLYRFSITGTMPTT